MSVGGVVVGVCVCVGYMCEVSVWWWLLWSGIEVVGADMLTGTGVMNALGRRPTCLRQSWQVLSLASAWLLAEEAR